MLQLMMHAANYRDANVTTIHITMTLTAMTIMKTQ
jgi:hypothetical protein